jgi:hypothetical protein
MASPMPELHNYCISDRWFSHVGTYIRIMSLEMNQLREEAREMNVIGNYPINSAASSAWPYPLRVFKRLQLANPAEVNALEEVVFVIGGSSRSGGSSALMRAAEEGNAELVDLLCEMGSCIGYRNDLDGRSTYNAFEAIISYSDEDEIVIPNRRTKKIDTLKAATLAIFEKHGVTSSTIAPNYHSPLYYESIYYTRRVADTNWAQFGMILMCMEEIDVKYRKRGERALTHLTEDAKCFFRVFCLVDGTDGLGNGIARILLTYIGGENMRKRLKGVPLDPKF